MCTLGFLAMLLYFSLLLPSSPMCYSYLLRCSRFTPSPCLAGSLFVTQPLTSYVHHSPSRCYANTAFSTCTSVFSAVVFSMVAAESNLSLGPPVSARGQGRKKEREERRQGEGCDHVFFSPVGSLLFTSLLSANGQLPCCAVSLAHRNASTAKQDQKRQNEGARARKRLDEEAQPRARSFSPSNLFPFLCFSVSISVSLPFFLYLLLDSSLSCYCSTTRVITTTTTAVFRVRG